MSSQKCLMGKRKVVRKVHLGRNFKKSLCFSCDDSDSDLVFFFSFSSFSLVDMRGERAGAFPPHPAV